MSVADRVSIRDATRSYEAWMRRQTAVVEADLRLKHTQMQATPFRFLRATFYRWLELWPAVCPKPAGAPRVTAIGDLHVENFGTWRDIEGRLVWGVNDVDEVCTLPYTSDLIRLATSAILAVRETHFRLDPADACVAILEGYVKGLEQGGRPFVLAEQRRWLRAIAVARARNPAAFWERLHALRRVSDPRVPHARFRASLPERSLQYSVVRRVAGLGSLGRQRYVALASWGGAFIAREAKAYVPPAATRTTKARDLGTLQRLLSCAARVSDPWLTIDRHWIVRRLAPDSTKIEIADLPARRDEHRLLRAMGAETANIHVRWSAPVLAHLRSRSKRWLERAAIDMADAVSEDWRRW
jgi:Uncharacterized protein conserved in bacteria (DUF2252)